MTAASPSSNPLPPTSKVVELMGPAVGGIRTHVAELTRRLRAAGRDVVVAGPPDALGHLGRNDVVVDVPAGLSPWGLVRARRQLGRVEGQLLHAHGLKAGWVAVGDPRRRPVVLTLHNLVLEESSGRSARVMRELERRLVRRVDRVIAPSPAIASGCEGLIAPDRLAVIVPVSPSPVPRRPRAEVRAELGADGAGPLVVVVARLHPQKDLSTFLRAMKLVAARVPDVRAAIVGQGPLEAELVRAIDELGLRETVRLAGPSDHAVDELAAADVVALTSVWEAVPLVVAEAAQLGRPIVSTDVGIVSELVSDGVDGFVVAVGDADGVAAALIEVLSRGERDEMGRHAREVAVARIDPDRLVDEVVGVYDGLVAPRPGPDPEARS